MDIAVTNHCIVRYLERIDGFDFTELHLEYIMDQGLPSIRHIVDGEFIRWLSRKISLEHFRDEIKEIILANIDENQMKVVVNQPKNTVYVAGPKSSRFVVTNRHALTVTLPRLRPKMETA